jgi:hypothetical protein
MSSSLLSTSTSNIDTTELVMRFQNIGIWFLGAFTLAAFSCKDMGHERDSSASPLTASQSSVNLSPGGQATVTISGGRAPHSISEIPDTTIAVAAITNLPNGSSSLVVSARSTATFARTTSVKVKEADAHGEAPSAPLHGEQEITIGITVGPSVSFSSQIQPIFTASCVNAGCHPGGSAPFSLASGASYANLVNVSSIAGPCAVNMMRVLPGNPAASSLVNRLEGTSCGVQMPLGGSPLPVSQLQLIRDWISQGAPNN